MTARSIAALQPIPDAASARRVSDQEPPRRRAERLCYNDVRTLCNAIIPDEDDRGPQDGASHPAERALPQGLRHRRDMMVDSEPPSRGGSATPDMIVRRDGTGLAAAD